MSAGERQLRGLTAGRRAQIGDAPATDLAEEPHWQRRASILNPPRAFGKTRQRAYRARRYQTYRSGRKHAAAELFGPMFGIAFDGEVERRLGAVGGGNRARGRRAVSRGPARHQPIRCVEHRCIERGEARGAFPRQAPQHGIDQTGKSGGPSIGLHEPDRKVDGGMVGYIEKKNLCRADEQRGLDPRRLGGQAAIKEQPEKTAQRAEPAQHRGDQNTHQCPVALREAHEFAC